MKIEKTPDGKASQITISKSSMKGDWVECPECGRSIKTKNMEKHAKKVHDSNLHVREIKKMPSSMPVLAIATIIIIALAGTGYVIYDLTQSDGEDTTIHQSGNNPPGSSGPDDTTPDDTTPDDTTPDNTTPDETEWWETYTPVNSKGFGDDDWWINYPSQHPDAGTAVSHPQWILDALRTKPVVILDHTTGCAPCAQQGEDMATVLEEHGDEVNHYDIIADGSDQRAYDVFDAYDPNAAQSYVPLTVFITLIGDGGGNVVVAWHSAEGATGEDWIRGYMEDAVYYHHQNLKGWSG